MKRIGLLLLALAFSASVWALRPEIEVDRLLLQARAALDESQAEPTAANHRLLMF